MALYCVYLKDFPRQTLSGVRPAAAGCFHSVEPALRAFAQGSKLHRIKAQASLRTPNVAPHEMMFSRYNLLAVVLTLAAVSFALAGDTGAFKSVVWKPAQLQSGSACLFTVEFAGAPSALHGKWMDRDVAFFQGGDGPVWYGLAGVDVEAKPGEYDLTLEAMLPDGRILRSVQPIRVSPSPYRTVRIRVPDKFVQPDPETLRRVEAEKEIKKQAFAHQAPAPEWSGSFVAPLKSTLSETFGTRRTFNGQLASIHRGLDYHAKTGTPVHAANAGEVVLARELFYEGNCVVIDHGQHFMTLYMHLSKIDVAEGERVKKGQQIGLSGSTGRATGPHLHLGVRWEGAYLNPASLMRLTLPRWK
ncbi:MAG: M23 family metallopeptidase [Acidobacteriia bacterium]|nr:M23 family metallopeptidase [Terriglobia bacterium]